MRIAIVSYQGYDGAGVLHAHEFANQLSALGHDVLFLLNGLIATSSVLADKPLYEIVEVSFRDGLMDPDSAARMTGFSPDIIHLWTPRHLPARVGLEGYQSTGAALVIHYEDDEEYILKTINPRSLSRDDLALYRLLSAIEPEPNLLHELVGTIDRDYLRLTIEDPTSWFWIHPLVTPIIERLAVGITCISPSYLREKSECLGKPGRILYPGVDHQRFGSAAASPELIESLGLKDRTVLLYSGTIAPFHDFVSVLKALPGVAQEYPDIVLLQIGRNLMEEITDEIVGRLELENFVCFAGPVPHHSMEKYLALADVFVGCVRADSFNEHRLPSKVPEYLAVGRPVVISAEGVGRELEEGLEAEKVASDAPEEIEAALLRILAKREQWPKIGARVQQKARQLFNWKRNAEMLVGYYEELLARQETTSSLERIVSVSSPELQVPKHLETASLRRRSSSLRVVICTESQIGSCLSGVGIRYLEIAKVLSRHFEVVLGHRGAKGFKIDGVEVFTWSEREPARALRAAQEADVVLIHGYVLEKLPAIREAAKRLVVDLYCPFIFENLEIHRDRAVNLKERELIHHNDLQVLEDQVRAGDYFLCCTEGQRNWLMGMLTAMGRLSPLTCPVGVASDDFIGLVPFGLPDDNPVLPAEPVLKGVWEGVGPDDLVLLWGGGLWSWLDPGILIEAMAEVSAQRQDVKLVFLSTLAAEPVIDMPTSAAAMARATELGLEGRSVIFNRDRYIPYSERSAYFAEADFGICAHVQSLESEMAFRTRLLDCVYTGLPILTSEGDFWGELVAREGIGRSVPIGEVSAWARVILEEAADPKRRERRRAALQRVRDSLRWSRVVEPIVRFVEASEESIPLAGMSVAVSRPSPPTALSYAANSEDSLEWMEAEARSRLLRLAALEARSQALEQVTGEYERLLGHAARLEAKIELIKKIPLLSGLWRRFGQPAQSPEQN